MNTLGYLYSISSPESICPTGWNLPTDIQANALNNQAGNTTSSYITGNLFTGTSISVGSNYAFHGYWVGNNEVSYYLGSSGSAWSTNHAYTSTPAYYGPVGSFK